MDKPMDFEQDYREDAAVCQKNHKETHDRTQSIAWAMAKALYFICADLNGLRVDLSRRHTGTKQEAR